jgi:hypothetical protein
MFTGFASENTPAIQVWDFFRTFASTNAVRSVSLADDCAPIQYFRTGATTTAINLYLPTCPIEGKQIKFINSNYGGNAQTINIYASDVNFVGTGLSIVTLGQGQTLDLCYSKNFLSAIGNNSLTTGWITLNQTTAGAVNYYSVLLGGVNNSASGSNSAVFGGNSNIASADSASVVGGGGNTASGQQSSVFGGNSNSASANFSAVVGGQAHTANGQYSICLGGGYGATRAITGNTVFPASNTPITFFNGAQQSAILILGRQTTDATATVLASNVSAAQSTNQVILPNNSAYYFKGSITAGVTGAGNSAMWSFEGGIKRGVGVGTTVLVGTPVLNVVAQDSGASTWVVALTADTTNGGLAVTVTGQAATTIRWVCKIETTEMTY